MKTGSLGSIVFEVSSNFVLTPGSFSHEAAARYTDHEVHGAKPVPEYTGAELRKMKLPIVLRRSLGVNPMTTLQTLVDMVEKGTVARLVILGQNMGKVTVRQVSSDWKYSAAGGVPEMVTINLDLVEYR